MVDNRLKHTLYDKANLLWVCNGICYLDSDLLLTNHSLISLTMSRERSWEKIHNSWYTAYNPYRDKQTKREAIFEAISM